MNGTTDDAHIYNRALSADEVKQLYLRMTPIAKLVRSELATAWKVSTRSRAESRTETRRVAP